MYVEKDQDYESPGYCLDIVHLISFCRQSKNDLHNIQLVSSGKTMHAKVVRAKSRRKIYQDHNRYVGAELA